MRGLFMLRCPFSCWLDARLEAAERLVARRIEEVGAAGPHPELDPLADPRRDAALTADDELRVVAAHADERLAAVQRRLLVDLAARHRLPAVYPYRYFALSGGLLAYGPDVFDQYRRAAAYVDKILKGAKPGELPVEQPTKFELAINLKTAKQIGFTIPQSVLYRADRVIK